MITSDIQYIGVNDDKIRFFEGQYSVPNGMAYNSYLILDEKIVVFDTVDGAFGEEWLAKIQTILKGRSPDYLIVQHMEPDHSANIIRLVKTYPQVTVVASNKAFAMMKNFYGDDFATRRKVVDDGEKLSLGSRELTFFTAPMVHWPEVIVTYDESTKTLFSADAFGKFGSNAVEEDWACEARRYYFGIVGKYGIQVRALLKKLENYDIVRICPLHGPVLEKNIAYYLRLYDTWSGYSVESEGIVIAYTSVYGNTKEAVEFLKKSIEKLSCIKVVLHDLACGDCSEVVEDAFRYDTIVLATTTYNGDIFPFMRNFIDALVERNFQNRTVAFIENGSWSPMATRVMKGMLEKCKNLSFVETEVKLLSALSKDSEAQLFSLATELCKRRDKNE